MSVQHQDRDAYADHEEILHLIPWFVNGSLEAGEKRRVQLHLQVCLECRAELKLQQSIAEGVLGVDVKWQEIKQNFESLRRSQAKSPAMPRGVPRRRLLYTAAACFALAAMALTLLLLRQPTPAEFHTLSSSASLTRSTAGDIVLVFESSLTRAEIELLLQTRGLEIVSAAEGMRMVRVRSVRRGAAPGELQAIVDELQAADSVVFAELAITP